MKEKWNIWKNFNFADRSVRAAEDAWRGGRPPASRQTRRQTHQALWGAGKQLFAD